LIGSLAQWVLNKTTGGGATPTAVAV